MQRIEIVIKGLIDQSWSEWFDGFEIIHAAGRSILEGPVRDQAELRGILTRLADLGCELVSVNTLSDSLVPEKQVRGGSEYKNKNNDL
jgi:hypothetical protein